MKPTISIIIPAHNEENYISKTLQSIKNQTSSDYEVIVVLNGCTDDTANVLKEFKSDKLKILSLPKANVSRARNYGAGNAEGEILLFLDADTYFEENALEKIKEEFNSEYSVASTKVKADSKFLKYKFAMWFKNMYTLKGFYKSCSGALICHRNQFDKVEGYDPKIVVREHKKLINKLNTLGKYTCLDITVTTSMRRFRKWGLSKATLFWARQWLNDHFGDLKRTNYEKIR